MPGLLPAFYRLSMRFIYSMFFPCRPNDAQKKKNGAPKVAPTLNTISLVSYFFFYYFINFVSRFFIHGFGAMTVNVHCDANIRMT